ncbi:hypothetical protein chiPu_0021743 [Chiloscyllium punctatum]|uniref:Uncharacterized protein n=1 Tax=Chiloscyllium punctatum TaxID=137246 RepID=A0A401RLC2_CHIPU|nr:hypothetical protein [Chiloscyllium punctatum]
MGQEWTEVLLRQAPNWAAAGPHDLGTVSGAMCQLEGGKAASGGGDREERPSLAVDLSTVKMEGSGSAGTESSQPSSPSRGVGTSHQQVKSEGPAPTSQQVESDSGCDPSSDSERSIPKECSVGSILPDPELEPCVEGRVCKEGRYHQEVGRIRTEAPGNRPARDPARAEVDSNSEPRSGSEVSAQEEGPNGAPRMECSPMPSAEGRARSTVVPEARVREKADPFLPDPAR